MTDDRIDFSSLDPSRDPKRWEAMIASVTARAAAAVREREREVSFAGALLRWARPAVVFAALLALGAWGGAALLGGGGARSTVAAAEKPENMLMRWAASDATPSTAEALEVLVHGQP